MSAVPDVKPAEQVTRPPILELVDVHAAYGRIEVLRGVNLSIPHGSVVALLGPNGAGKTTTLKVASGQMEATSGHVHIGGVHTNKVASEKLVKAGVCTIPEGRGIFPNLSVDENIRLFGYVGTTSDSAIRESVFSRFPRLKERRSQLAGRLSGGEQQMLAMARALMSRPKLLLLDEPSMGLAPLMVERIFEVVRQIASEGVTLLLVEQNARLALETSHRGYVLDGGTITISGESRALLGDARVREAYLGE